MLRLRGFVPSFATSQGRSKMSWCLLNLFLWNGGCVTWNMVLRKRKSKAYCFCNALFVTVLAIRVSTLQNHPKYRTRLFGGYTSFPIIIFIPWLNQVPLMSLPRSCIILIELTFSFKWNMFFSHPLSPSALQIHVPTWLHFLLPHVEEFSWFDFSQNLLGESYTK